MANPNVQSFELKNVRTAAILTTAYVAGTVLNDCVQYNQLMVFIDFTIGSLTSLEIKVEFSKDGENYYQETFSTISGGTSTDSLGAHTMTASGAYCLSIPIKCTNVRISAKGTGTVTGSSLTIDAALAVA